MKAELIHEHGVARIRINGEVVSSVSFRSFWPQPGITRDFGKGGIRLMNVYPSGILCSLDVPYSQFGEYWIGEGEYDWDVLRAQVNQFVENAPDAYLSLLLQLDPRDWYLKAHPECQNTFDHLPEGLCYGPWREAAKQCIRDTLDFLEKEYPERFYAVYVCVGGTCEWINRFIMDEEPNKAAAFRAWSGDAARRLPTAQELTRGSHGMIFDGHENHTVEYNRFISELVAGTIREFAHEVKAHSPGLLVGCFCGYLMAHEAYLNDRCQNGLVEQVYECPDVDMIFSPASYVLRGLEDVSNSHVPIASVRLHGKMYYHEIDNTTFLSNANPYAQVLQTSAHRRHKSLRESIQYARREAALTFAGLGTYWWFDMFGGWYDSEEIQKALLDIGKAQERLYAKDVRSNAEVAYLVDEESELHMGRGNVLHDQISQKQMSPLGRVGCQVDYYAASDLLDARFDRNQYKLYIFPDLVAPKPEMRKAIEELRRMGASLLFVYAPGIVKDGEYAPEAMEELTGIRLRVSDRKFGYTVAHEGEWNDDGMDRVFGGRMDGAGLFVEADEPDEYVFGHGLVSKAQQFVVKKRENGGFDAWIAQGMMPDYVLRPLVKAAGCFQWTDSNQPVYTNSRMFAMFDHEGGERRVRVPWTSGRLEEMYTGETHTIRAGEEVALRFDADECKCFIHLEDGEV